MHNHPALYSPYNIHNTLYTPYYTLNILHPTIYTTHSTPYYSSHFTPHTTLHTTPLYTSQYTHFQVAELRIQKKLSCILQRKSTQVMNCTTMYIYTEKYMHCNTCKWCNETYVYYRHLLALHYTYRCYSMHTGVMVHLKVSRNSYWYCSSCRCHSTSTGVNIMILLVASQRLLTLL